MYNKLSREYSALKIINKKKLNNSSLDILRNEAKILQNLDHPNIVKFKHFYETIDFIMLELEYVKGGMLKKVFTKSHKLTEQDIS